MRTQEMFYIVNRALDYWIDPEFEEHRKNGSVESYSCKNASQVVLLLNMLAPFESIKSKIDKIYSINKTFYSGKPGALTPQEQRDIESAMAQIKRELQTMRSTCEALGVERESSGFDIKLPPGMTLAELAECTKDLNNVFSQCPLFQNDNEEIRFHGVDVGSAWLTFTVVGAGVALTFYVINNLAAVVDRLMTIREHCAVCRQQEELARASKLKNELLESIVEANKAIIKQQMQTVAEELADKEQINNPEAIERIRGSMELLKKWLDRGMEVYAAIDAPSEVKSAFPPVERQSLPDTLVKALTEAVGDKSE